MTKSKLKPNACIYMIEKENGDKVWKFRYVEVNGEKINVDTEKEYTSKGIDYATYHYFGYEGYEKYV